MAVTRILFLFSHSRSCNSKEKKQIRCPVTPTLQTLQEQKDVAIKARKKQLTSVLPVPKPQATSEAKMQVTCYKQSFQNIPQTLPKSSSNPPQTLPNAPQTPPKPSPNAPQTLPQTS